MMLNASKILVVSLCSSHEIARTKPLAMRRIAFLFLLFPLALSAQEGCELFNVQELAAEFVSLQVNAAELQADGSYLLHFSNGNSQLVKFGCTDPNFDEFDASATMDDGSCATPPCSAPTIDGHSYEVVEIGAQCWFAENLFSSVYSNGVPIASGIFSYNNDPSFDQAYGKLYTWHVANDPRGLCPTGWHVPEIGEWSELVDFVSSQGFTGSEAVALKASDGWFENGSDDFGFSAQAGGQKAHSSDSFNFIGSHGYHWSQTPSGISEAYYFSILHWVTNPIISDAEKEYGWSIRCIKD